MIYMDNAATTPMRKEVASLVYDYSCENYYNPSGIYTQSEQLKRQLENARKRIGQSINAYGDEIYFTSGGTESDNWALRMAVRGYEHKGRHIITSKIEHPAILNTCKDLESLGYDVTYVGVDSKGVVEVNQIINSIRDDTILISIMTANNEVGTIQPIYKIGMIARENNVLFHTDAVGAYSKLKLDVKRLNIDMLSVSGHKIRGPKGIGFLYINRNVIKKPLIYGGGQERKLRSGTENVPGIMGMSKAVELGFEKGRNDWQRVAKLRDYFIGALEKNIDKVYLNGSRDNRLPDNINMSFEGVNGIQLAKKLNERDILVSTTSACSSRSKKPSHVLKAMGIAEELINSTIRFTLSEDTTFAEINKVVYTVADIVNELRRSN